MRRKPFIAVIAFVISVIAAAFLVLREEPKVPEKKEALIEPLPSSGVVTYREGDTDQRRFQLRRIDNGILQEACLVTPKGSWLDVHEFAKKPTASEG